MKKGHVWAHVLNKSFVNHVLTYLDFTFVLNNSCVKFKNLNFFLKIII